MNCMNPAKHSCKILLQIANYMVEEKASESKSTKTQDFQTYSRACLLVHLVKEWNKDAINATTFLESFKND